MAAADGLDSLTIGEVAKRLGLSKSGVFSRIGSREALQAAVIDEYARRFLQDVFTPAMREPRGLPRLNAIMRLWMQRARDVETRSGCLYCAGAFEYDDREGPLRDLLLSHVQRWRAALKRTVHPGHRGRPPARRHRRRPAGVRARRPVHRADARSALPARPARRRPQLGGLRAPDRLAAKSPPRVESRHKPRSTHFLASLRTIVRHKEFHHADRSSSRSCCGAGLARCSRRWAVVACAVVGRAAQQRRLRMAGPVMSSTSPPPQPTRPAASTPAASPAAWAWPCACRKSVAPAAATRLALRLFFTPLPLKLAARRQTLPAPWRVEHWPFEHGAVAVYRRRRWADATAAPDRAARARLGR